MRAINHALAGALIGTIFTVPVVAVPIALVSHFALDTVPHFGVDRQTDIKKKWFGRLLVLDVILCAVLVSALFVAHHKGWLLAAICAFVAAVPDFMLLPRFYRAKRLHNTSRATHSALVKFHDEIQTETPFGAVIEVLWLPCMVYLLISLSR